MTSAARRRATPRVAATVAVAALAAGGALGGCSRKAVTVTLPTVPSTLELRQYTSTTKGIDHSSDTLVVDATDAETVTSTIGFEAGRVTFKGTVTGPDGPVAGATVHIERLVGTQVAVREVVTDDAGRYLLENVEGGRVRLRAWRAPDLAAVNPIVAFASGSFSTDLKLQGFGTTSVRWGIAPATPIIGRAANVVIQLSADRVGTDGVVRPTPVEGVGITVTPLGLLQSDVVQEVVTNASGRVQIAMRCNGVGPADLLISLATGERTQIAPPSCAPVPTTTIPVPSTVVPDSGVPATVGPGEPATVVVTPGTAVGAPPVEAAATVAPSSTP